MQERIMKLCEELCCKQVGTEEQLIAEGMLDSFKLMELICSLEEEFGITFVPDEITELDNFSTINSIVEIIKTKTYVMQ